MISFWWYAGLFGLDDWYNGCSSLRIGLFWNLKSHTSIVFNWLYDKANSTSLPHCIPETAALTRKFVAGLNVSIGFFCLKSYIIDSPFWLPDVKNFGINGFHCTSVIADGRGPDWGVPVYIYIYIMKKY